MLFEQIKKRPFFILGPCVIESEALLEEVAEAIKSWQRQFPQFVFIFKASFDKANRTSLDSFRGPGLEAGLAALARIKARYDLPILSDIHEAWQAAPAAEVLDVIQIPAFLCRQTDLLLAAARTSAIVNVKKAQFLAPQDMRYVLDKLKAAGKEEILLTERGTMFGYQNLVVDFLGLAEMRDYAYPLVMDATHSVQKPGAAGGKSGGKGHYAPLLARAAAALGVRGFFIETHPQPRLALSDGPNMIALSQMPDLLRDLEQIFACEFAF